MQSMDDRARTLPAPAVRADRVGVRPGRGWFRAVVGGGAQTGRDR
ncbi:hypothetical protein SFR_0389 [Streptomyces sp. FR-008]|nr:hypothetical protein SFR_0389 [Streptomyces sp. FR-008]